MYHVYNKRILLADPLVLKSRAQARVVRDTLVVMEINTVPGGRVVKATEGEGRELLFIREIYQNTY